MKQLTSSIALFFLLLPLAALAQQTQVATETTAKSVPDSANYVLQGAILSLYLCKGEEKMPVFDRGFLVPEVKAQFKPYPNACRAILSSERHTRRTAVWGWVGLGIGSAGAIYTLATRKNGQYNYGIDLAGTALLVGTAVTATYHFGKNLKSRRKAVDYFNARQ